MVIDFTPNPPSFTNEVNKRIKARIKELDKMKTCKPVKNEK